MPNKKVAAIVHDEMRAEEVRLKHAQPEFYQIFKAFYPNFFQPSGCCCQDC